MRAMMLAGGMLACEMLACAMLLPVAAIAQDMPPPGGHRGPGHAGAPPRVGGRLFISPMGEPFRSDKGGPESQELWFVGADVDHDKSLTRLEFEKDALRFFLELDRGHDGEIDPEDIEYYETVLAPEIRVGAGGYGGIEGGGDGNSSSRPIYPDRQGAARFGYFGFPEPITAADTNYNRGVSWPEFRRAADDRFDVLDTNGDGKIDHAELPRIASPQAEDRFRSTPGGGARPGELGGGRRGGAGGGQPGGGYGQDR